MHDDGLAFGVGFASVRLGTFAGVGADGFPRVALTGSGGAEQVARSLVGLEGVAAGAEIAVAFAEEEPERPLILGVVQPPERIIEADGRTEIVGEREVVLRCGPASIRLTADGRVTVRGTRILSRAEASNRVQGQG